MTKLNDEFMEAYKQLDKICREMYSNEKGLTTYINEMESQRNGALHISSWNTTLHKLKKYRHIRNAYVHEVGTSASEICTMDDINWLNAFYVDILQSRDPLAQYRKYSQEKDEKDIMEVSPINLRNKEASPGTGLGKIILAALGISAFVLLAIFVIVFILLF